MKKRILALTLTLALVLPCFGVVQAAQFSDFSSSHWAYDAVMTLVEDGTINGFTDGTFRPNATVSRAQFVKMIGKGTEISNATYTDVSPDEWYYEYVITSGLDPISAEKFEPDTPITRNDVVNLLWKRNGSGEVENAPVIITSQGTNPTAVGWVYAKGIMMGDDYINLRLNDSLTRAEAAALIVRARNNVNAKNVDFVANMNDKELKVVYDSLNLFDDKAYEPNATVTNGELAHMAIRLAEGRHKVMYTNFSCEIPFEHKYAQSLDAYGKYCIGEDKINKTYINKAATGADAAVAIAFGLFKTSMTYLEFGDMNDYYTDISSVGNEKVNKYLTLAYNSGLSLYGDGRINANKPITLRELTTLLMQADSVSGFNRVNTFADRKGFANYKINTNFAAYPSNANKYAVIFSGIDKDVYQTEFVTYANGDNFGVPKVMYDRARDFKEVYNNMVEHIAKPLNNKGEKIKITYYPSMVVDNGNGITTRVKIDVIDVTDGINLGSLIPVDAKVKDITLTDGMSIYVDIESGEKLSSVYYTSEKAFINKIVKVVK